MMMTNSQEFLGRSTHSYAEACTSNFPNHASVALSYSLGILGQFQGRIGPDRPLVAHQVHDDDDDDDDDDDGDDADDDDENDHDNDHHEDGDDNDDD